MMDLGDVMYQCSFLMCDKHTTQEGDVDNGGGSARVEQGLCETSLDLPLQVFANLELL